VHPAASWLISQRSPCGSFLRNSRSAASAASNAAAKRSFRIRPVTAGLGWSEPSATFRPAKGEFGLRSTSGPIMGCAPGGDVRDLTGAWTLEIVRRRDRHAFVVLPKRRIVERTIGWIGRNRRLARDLERHCRIAAAFVRPAMVRLRLRRVAQRPSA
jgi:hypothetical protein